MADNIEFRSDMADEGHIGEAVGLYEADKRIVHLSAPNVGNRSVPVLLKLCSETIANRRILTRPIAIPWDHSLLGKNCCSV